MFIYLSKLQFKTRQHITDTEQLLMCQINQPPASRHLPVPLKITFIT
jgi:hypothetical protein